MWKTARALKARNERLSMMRYMDDSDSGDFESDGDKMSAISEREKSIIETSAMASSVEAIIEGKRNEVPTPPGVTGSSRLLIAKKSKRAAREQKDSDHDWDEESIYAPSSDDDMTIETQRYSSFQYRGQCVVCKKAKGLGAHHDAHAIQWPDVGKLPDFANMCNGWPSSALNIRSHRTTTSRVCGHLCRCLRTQSRLFQCAC